MSFPDRVYVRVNTDFDQVGTVTPRAIIWADGRRFPIDTVESCRPASAVIPNHPGDVYTVKIGREKRLLFFQRTRLNEYSSLGRWWVEPDLC